MKRFLTNSLLVLYIEGVARDQSSNLIPHPY